MAAAPIVGLVLAAIGTGVSVYSAVSQGEEEAAAREREAAAREAQAAEIARRQKKTEELIRRRGEETKARQQSLYVKAGVSTTTGAPLITQVQTEQDIIDEIQMSKQESQWTIQQILTGAKEQRSLADSSRTGGYLRAGGTALSGFSQAYGNYASSKAASDQNKLIQEYNQSLMSKGGR